jgi:hypothetical protein
MPQLRAQGRRPRLDFAAVLAKAVLPLLVYTSEEIARPMLAARVHLLQLRAND